MRLRRGAATKLVDRTGEEFPIVQDGGTCRSVLLNGKKLYLLDKLQRPAGTGALGAAAELHDGERRRGGQGAGGLGARRDVRAGQLYARRSTSVVSE